MQRPRPSPPIALLNPDRSSSSRPHRSPTSGRAVAVTDSDLIIAQPSELVRPRGTSGYVLTGPPTRRDAAGRPWDGPPHPLRSDSSRMDDFGAGAGTGGQATRAGEPWAPPGKSEEPGSGGLAYTFRKEGGAEGAKVAAEPGSPGAPGAGRSPGNTPTALALSGGRTSWSGGGGGGGGGGVPRCGDLRGGCTTLRRSGEGLDAAGDHPTGPQAEGAEFGRAPGLGTGTGCLVGAPAADSARGSVYLVGGEGTEAGVSPGDWNSPPRP